MFFSLFQVKNTELLCWPVEMKTNLGGYQLRNIVGHHGLAKKKIFHFKSSQRHGLKQLEKLDICWRQAM